MHANLRLPIENKQAYALIGTTLVSACIYNRSQSSMETLLSKQAFLFPLPQWERICERQQEENAVNWLLSIDTTFLNCVYL